MPLDGTRSPTDNYRQAHVLLEKIADLSGSTESLPEVIQGRRVPADVLAVLLWAQQEIDVIKAAAGSLEPTQKFPYLAGKIPPDVYQQICLALYLVDTFR